MEDQFNTYNLGVSWDVFGSTSVPTRTRLYNDKALDGVARAALDHLHSQHPKNSTTQPFEYVPVFKAKPMSPLVERAVEDRKSSFVSVFDPAGEVHTHTGVYTATDPVTKEEFEAKVATMFTAEDYRKGLINARAEETNRSDRHNYCMRKIAHLAKEFPFDVTCGICEEQPEGCLGYGCSACEQFVCTECFPQSMSSRLVEDDNGIDLHYCCPYCRKAFVVISRSRNTTMTSPPAQGTV